MPAKTKKKTKKKLSAKEVHAACELREQRRVERQRLEELERKRNRLTRLAELVAPLNESMKERIDAGGQTPLGLLPEAEALKLLRERFFPETQELKYWSNSGNVKNGLYRKTYCNPHYGDRPGAFYIGTVDAASWANIQKTKALLLTVVDADGNKLPAPTLLGKQFHCGQEGKHSDGCKKDFALWEYALEVSRDLGKGLHISAEYATENQFPKEDNLPTGNRFPT